MWPVIFCCLKLAFASEDNGASENARLLVTGSFLSDVTSAVTGDEYYGLFRLGVSYEVKKVVVHVARCHDPVVDKEGEETGQQVSISSKLGQPIFLVTGVANIKEGPVKTVFDGVCPLIPLAPDIGMGGAQGVHLGGEGGPELVATGKEGQFTSIKDYRLYYQKQELLRHDGFTNNCIPELLWAGDLDGDGKLDLFLDMNVYESLREWTLFLSSTAEKGQFLKKAACLQYSPD